jgi:hypothetical protein
MIGQPTMNEKSAELAHYGMLLEVSVPPTNRTKKYNKHQILLSLTEIITCLILYADLFSTKGWIYCNIHNTMQRDLYEAMRNKEYDTLGTLNTERMFRVRFY